MGRHLALQSVAPPGAPNYSATRAPNAAGSGGHRFSGAGSSPAFSSPDRIEGWHGGSMPPGWTGHGEKRDWDGERMPPGSSHRDPPWRDRQLYRGAESGERERAQFDTGQLERRWGW
jgi:hypothetical protein